MSDVKRYILMTRITGVDGIYYRVYDIETNKCRDIPFKELRQLDKEDCMNFKISGVNSIVHNGSRRLKMSFIPDKKHRKQYMTFISSDGATVKLINHLGILGEVTIDEYKDLQSKYIINNDIIEETPVEETPVEETPVEETPVEETKESDTEDKQLETNKTQTNVDDTLKIDDKSQTNTEEIEEVTVEPEQTEPTEEQLTNIQILTFLSHLSSMDRVTISKEVIKIYGIRLEKILESNMHQTRYLAICRIYTNSDRTKFIHAACTFDDNSEKCNVQIICTYTDKNDLCTIDEYYRNYTKWNNDLRYITMR